MCICTYKCIHICKDTYKHYEDLTERFKLPSTYILNILVWFAQFYLYLPFKDVEPITVFNMQFWR